MKKLIFLVPVIALAIVASAQNYQLNLKSTNGALLEFGSKGKITTTDSTITTIETISVGADESGILEVYLLGFNDSTSTAITGSKIVRYVKKAGTLTLGTPTDNLATVRDAELNSSTTWNIAVNGSNNIIVTVKGKAGYKIRWSTVTRKIHLRS